MLTAQKETQTDAFGAYKLYLALRLHFNSDSYDAVKYNFKTSGGDLEKFRNKPEAYWFNALAKKYTFKQLIQVFLAQFLAGKKWGGMHTSQADFEGTYTDWLRKIESLTYTFEQDLATLKVHLETGGKQCVLSELFVCDSGRPFVIDRYHRKQITLETITLLDILTGFVLKCDTDVKDTILWPKTKRLIKKYEPFLELDRSKFRAILLQNFPLRGEAG